MTTRAAMTSAERIEAALDGRPADHVPFSPFLAYVWESFPKAVIDAGQLAFHHAVGADPLWRGAPGVVKAIGPDIQVRTNETATEIVIETETPVGTLRQRSRKSDEGNTCFLVEHPCKDEEDFKVLRWIEENTRLEFDDAAARQHLAEGNGREGLSLGMLIPRAKSAFQSLVEHHAGTEELIYALMDFPEVVEETWRVMVEKDIEAVRLAAEGPYRYWITWEDSSTQNYSPGQYDTYIGSEIGQWCEILASRGKRYIQHACGHVRDLVGRMKAHGAYGVESISPAPTGNVTIAEARVTVGGDFAIIGGIEPTEFLNRDMDSLASYTEKVVEEGKGGPFVLANSDSCPPGVTVEKFRLVADIARAARL